MDQAGRYISVLMRQLNLFFSHELSEVEITASELMYLSQLYRADGLTQEEMSMEISVDKAATTRTIQGMEKKGLITRRRSETDERSVTVAPTEAGLALREQAQAIPGKVGSCIPLVPEDAARLYSLLHELMEKLA